MNNQKRGVQEENNPTLKKGMNERFGRNTLRRMEKW
jgi:hypothetical protein